jgi:hypothetical protein
MSVEPASATERANLPRWFEAPLFVPLVLLGLTLAMFGDVLFRPNGRVLSALGQDLSTEFVYWRQFGFSQLRAGHIALWDPHVCGGLPFMGGFDAALFYPLNWIYLFLPLSYAINCEFALHVFLLGFFMSLWVGRWRLHPLAVVLGSSMVMFGGPFFPHLYAGHLSHMDSMAWTPLILLTVDQLIDEPRLKWVLVGILAFSMQVLAGYPQVLFCTIVTCLLYGAIRIFAARHRVKTLLAFAIVAVGALLITTVQLWTGLQAAGESTRHGGVSFAFAGSFSFPPENFLTILVPGFFGNMTGFPYWGRGDWWEMSLFLGLTGLTAAGFGVFTVKSPRRWVWLSVAAALLWIALGRHTPLFRLLYGYVPGFNEFRSPSKFIFDAGLFLAMLAALGIDALARSARSTRIAAATLLAGAIVLGGVGLLVRAGVNGKRVDAAWSQFMAGIAESGEQYLPFSYYADPAFLAAARQFAGSRCLTSAATLLVLAGLFFLRAYRTSSVYILAIFGVAEIFVFARSTVTTFPLSATVPTDVRRFLASHPGDYRILNLQSGTSLGPQRSGIVSSGANSAIALGAKDIWGYDPMVLQRYAEFVTFSQGENPADSSMFVVFRSISPLLRLLRLRFVFAPQGKGVKVTEAEGGLPHLLLVNNWQLIHRRDEILKTLAARSFDPETAVILESDPKPPPAPGLSKGTVQLVTSGTDSLTIAASVPQATLLLITDTYSRYWRAVPLPGSSQSRYQVLPADYTLIAVPLAAGRHLLRLEYAPSGYLVGRWISLAACVVYVFAVALFLIRQRLRS